MTYVLAPQARDELETAFAWYLEHASALVARRFVDEFERAATLLALHPELGTPTLNDRRQFSLRRFPYSLIYRAGVKGVRVVAVAHQRRKPRYWRERR